MASGTRSANTMVEGLRGMLAQIAELKIAPDANLEFLIGLETTVIQHLKAGADAALGQTAGPGVPGQPPPMMGMGGPPGMGGGMPGGMPGSMVPGTGTPPGARGVMQGPQMPNQDELRRMLSGPR